jgi:hypothetical protein
MLKHDHWFPVLRTMQHNPKNDVSSDDCAMLCMESAARSNFFQDLAEKPAVDSTRPTASTG